MMRKGENCFECGTNNDLHAHHVVPRVLGGSKTIPLCGYCHALVHDRHHVAIGSLVRATFEKKRLENEHTGGQVPYGYTVASDGVHLVEHEDEQLAIKIICKLRAAGLSLRAIVAELKNRDIVSRTGKALGLTQIARIVRQGNLALLALAIALCACDDGAPAPAPADASAEVVDPYGDNGE